MTREFVEFYVWVERHLGINLAAYKQQQLQRRITTVMDKSGVTSLKEYAVLIKKNTEVRERFLDYMTINVTDFFRNPDLFDEFEKVLVEELKPKFKNLKIWSAACSIGSEPYSLAMLMNKHTISLENKITATDVNLKVLEKAKLGRYQAYDLKNMETSLINQYFLREKNDYVLSRSIRNMVNFQQHDLLVDSFDQGYHVIVCRNVIIYFNQDVKEALYQKFSRSLAPGGILFTGATETIYKPERYGLEKVGTFLYQKVDNA